MISLTKPSKTSMNNSMGVKNIFCILPKCFVMTRQWAVKCFENLLHEHNTKLDAEYSYLPL